MSDLDDDHDDDQERTQLDRRTFGRILAAGVGGLALANVAAAEQAAPATAVPRTAPSNPAVDVDVVIVGAGLSGLIAARDLGKAGRTVRVIEAGATYGGRMTGRKINGGYVDFGGQWVGRTQYYMQALVAELNITPFESYELGRSVLSYDDTSFFNGDVAHLVGGDCEPPVVNQFDPRCKSDLRNCNALQYRPRNRAEAAVWNPLLDISHEVPPDRPWDAPDAANRDQETFATFLKGKQAAGFSDWLPTMISRIGGSGGFQPKDVSTLHMAWTQRVAPQAETPEMWLLCGGAGQIPERLVAQITAVQNALKNPNPVRTSSPVANISHSEAGVTVSGKDLNSGVSFAVKASAVIVAIPPPMRSRIRFEPKLPDQYREFADGSVMGTMSKVHAVYPEGPFWREECLSGSVAGDLKYCEFIADSSGPDSKKGPGILTSFITRSDIDKDLCSMSPKAAKRRVMDIVLAEYQQYFTGVYSNPGRFLNVRDDDFYWTPWNCTDWIGGAFTSYPKPGIWTGPGRIGWREPFGNIFWAGTEAADRWPGYFDGAINAGQAAAQRVQKRLFETTANQVFESRVSANCP